MNCVECEKREVCNECKSLELDNLDEGIKFSCYKFKPIMTDNAEIERLKREYDIMRFVTAKRWVKEAKAEARKEFAERLNKQLIPTLSALFRISETLVDVSKSHISSDRAIDKIREELQQNGVICSRLRFGQILDNLLEEMESERE